MTDMKWMPIETAPKDGTPVLVWCKLGKYDLPQSAYTVIFWEDESWQLAQSGGYAEDCYPSDPTYWMPLPSPPEGS